MRVNLLTAVAAAAFCQAEIGVAQDVAPDSPAPAQDPRLASPAAPVQTLQQALSRTYQTSPTLMAQRAELRGLDSDVALARAAGHPQITIEATAAKELYTTRQIGTLGRSLAASADVEQVLFAGGRIRNSVRSAKTQVIAGRADLRATEGDVFTEAVAAYADLLRDRETRDLNMDQVRVLETHLQSTRSRFSVGDVTRADVAQSEARLEKARSDLATAEGRLQFSEENFERVVGARAGALEPLPPLPPLPPTIDQAVEAALADNPVVAAFVARARAARYEVAATKAERLPTISAVNSTGYTNALGSADRVAGLPKGTLPNSATNIAAGLSLRLPLYQGGAASARVRRAEEATAKLLEQSTAAERLVVAGARANFVIWRKALSAITSDEAAVAANKESLESVKVEQVVAARSVLDVLNAEKELLDSRVALASSRRDAYVAAFELLNVMGAAEAAELNLDVGPLYDPKANYRSHARSWSDWDDGPRSTPASTRNVPEDVNSPLTRLKTGKPSESEKPNGQLSRGVPAAKSRAGWQTIAAPSDVPPKVTDARQPAQRSLNVRTTPEAVPAPAVPVIATPAPVAANAPAKVIASPGTAAAPAAKATPTAPVVESGAVQPPPAPKAAPVRKPMIIADRSATASTIASMTPSKIPADVVVPAAKPAVSPVVPVRPANATLPTTKTVAAPVVAAPAPLAIIAPAKVVAPAPAVPAPAAEASPAAVPAFLVKSTAAQPALVRAPVTVREPAIVADRSAVLPTLALMPPPTPVPAVAVVPAAEPMVSPVAPAALVEATLVTTETVTAPIVATPAVVANITPAKLEAPAAAVLVPVVEAVPVAVPVRAVETVIVQPARAPVAAPVLKRAMIVDNSAKVPTGASKASSTKVSAKAVAPAGKPAISRFARMPASIGHRAARANLHRNRPARAQTGVQRGSWVVQLGAYSSARRVEAGWQGAVHKYNPLDNYVPVSAAYGKRSATLHRLSFGAFPTRASARSVCLAIKARGADCFIRESAGDAPLQWALRARRSRSRDMRDGYTERATDPKKQKVSG